MTDLSNALAAVGESAPERPLTAWMGASAAVNALAGHVKELESLALRLAVRLAEVQPKPCERCRGRGWFRGVHAEDDFEITCNDCKGTGKEQPR